VRGSEPLRALCTLRKVPATLTVNRPISSNWRLSEVFRVRVRDWISPAMESLRPFVVSLPVPERKYRDIPRAHLRPYR